VPNRSHVHRIHRIYRIRKLRRRGFVITFISRISLKRETARKRSSLSPQVNALREYSRSTSRGLEISKGSLLQIRIWITEDRGFRISRGTRRDTNELDSNCRYRMPLLSRVSSHKHIKLNWPSINASHTRAVTSRAFITPHPRPLQRDVQRTILQRQPRRVRSAHIYIEKYMPPFRVTIR
jgi:hypothetical protein